MFHLIPGKVSWDSLWIPFWCNGLAFPDYTLHILSQRKIRMINVDKIKQDTHDYDMQNLQYEQVINF